MARIWFSLIIGLGGLAILLWLGIWQVQRLSWKQNLLADIDARISASPVTVPDQPDPETDRYLPVTVTGAFVRAETAGLQRMLASRRQTGAVYRHIAAFETDTQRRILVDLGWTPADTAPAHPPAEATTLIGNLDWPRETDGFTPAPDLTQGLWYARDVPAMAKQLGTEPVLIVLSQQTATTRGITPWPVNTSNIPNDHLQYAITWFSLAAVWAAMTFYFARRPRRVQPKG